MKTSASWKSAKIEQAWVVFYDCEREALIEKYDIRLVGTFAMPKKKWGKSIMTSINEHVRITSQKYLEEYDLGYRAASSEWVDYRKVNADMLHWAVMKIFADAIDSINAAWEPLFDIDIYIKKNKEKELLNEMNGLDKKIKMLEYEVEAKKKVDAIVNEQLKKFNINPQNVTNQPVNQANNQVHTPPQQVKVNKPVPKPAKKKWMQIGSFKFE